MRAIAKKIKDLRVNLGLTQPEFAKAINGGSKDDPVDQATISKWENGVQRPSVPHMAKIAALANVSVEQFAGLPSAAGAPRVTIPVTGEVQAGAWRDAAQWDEEDWREVSLPMVTEWSHFQLHARIVVGNSMNRLYPDGSIIYVVPIADLGRMPVSGENVVVQRVSADGEYEVSLKQYIEEDGKAYLWPRSTDPEFQAPLQYKKSKRGVERVEILGLVVMATVIATSAIKKPKLAVVRA
jgi:repressor LexA